MAVLSRFDPPAKLNDFQNDPGKAEEFATLWNINVNGWTQQAIMGNPWNATNTSNQTFYFNPLVTDIPAGVQQARVTWIAFPNRINFYLGSFTQSQLWEIADNGVLSDGTTFPNIPNASAICSQQTTPTIPYGPYGPRGWQDEYCEWSVRRDAGGNITRIDFTCENPEYWFTLWKVDPNTVLELYRQTLDNPNIQLEDLQLTYNGAPVIDPSTGQPAYNPLNKWNSGTRTTDASGGAMHLTSTPNNLATELALAGAATVLRQMGNSDPEQLVCCGQYGQPQRNSDPHIGQVANQVVAGSGGVQNQISLANPVGLYIQMPDFSGYQLPPNAPSDASPQDYWTIVRGSEHLDGFGNQYNFILHATYEVPAGLGFTVSDISIQGNPIQWASQIAQTFQIALNPMAFPSVAQQTPQPCVSYLDPPQALAQPLQLMPQALWDAYYNTPSPNPVGFKMNMAGNTSTAAPLVKQGSTAGVQMALTCGTTFATSEAPPTVQFAFPDGGGADEQIEVVVNSLSQINYAVPGNSYPSDLQLLSLTVYVSPSASPGQRDVLITNPGQSQGPAAPCYLFILPSDADQAAQTPGPSAVLDYARQNTGQALLLAAAAGFLIGLLVRGGRR
jgi:hypothetical protein